MQIADFLILIAGVLWTLETIPQIIKLVKTKNTEGISLLFFLICLCAYILFLIGNIILKNWSVVIAHCFPFVNLIVITYLIIKYRRLK